MRLDRACCGSAGSKGGLATFLGGKYEDFIEDHTKRDGRDRLDPTLGIRHSHTDITRAVRGARLHVIRDSCALIADPCSYRN